MDTKDLSPRPEHLVYSLYVLHCSSCALSLDRCPVLGCGIVRGLIRAEAEPTSFGTGPISSTNLTPLGDLVGNGSLPIERAVMTFLVYQSRFSTIFPPQDHHFLPPTPPVLETVLSHDTSRSINRSHSAMSHQSDSGVMLIADHDPPPNLIRPWKKIEDDGKVFRYLNRRVQLPSLSPFMTAEEVVEARGGHANREESSLPYSLTSAVSSAFLPPPPLLLERSVTSILNNDQPEVLEVVTRAPSMRVPCSLIKKMCGADLARTARLVPQHLFDPFPPKELSQVNPETDSSQTPQNIMSTAMFTWIIEHLKVSRPEQNPLCLSLDNEPADLTTPPLCSSTNTPQSDDNDVSLQFDRQYESGVQTLSDGSVIFLHALHGILPGSSRVLDNSSGCPAAAVRYLLSDQLETMLPGLTIHVHDILSQMSQVVFLEGRRLHMLCQQYTLDPKDYPRIASVLITHAPDLIVVQRTASGRCLDADLSLGDEDKADLGLRQVTPRSSRRVVKPVMIRRSNHRCSIIEHDLRYSNNLARQIVEESFFE
jgi:hypothetical protein